MTATKRKAYIQKMPSLPESIRVLHSDVKITEISESTARDLMHGVFATFNAKDEEIRIFVGDRQPMNVAESLIHELLHAIYHNYVIYDEDKEERTVCTMAGGIAQVWLDNPELIAFLDACAEAQRK